MSVTDPASTLIAWWGAGLSTLLALVKFYELWRDRSRVEVSYNFTKDLVPDTWIAYDASDRRLEPHTTLKLRFAEAHYFAWGHSALNGRSIYIRLHLAGRRPILRMVFAQ
jgi:hypothetical protein